MRVALPGSFAEKSAPAPRRDSQKPGPDLRLIGADAEPAAPRLGAIVAADMVDYTRHMADDEAGTHARYSLLRRTIIQPALARHGARIVKHTGDGFLAEFASANRAVWFAITFQEALRAWNARRARATRSEFRVGINLGDVIEEAHDVFGHSVNIAARLEAAARPGGVLISYAVYASVRDKRLLFEDAGNLSLKNVDEPVRGFHASLSASARPRRLRQGSVGWGEQRDSNP